MALFDQRKEERYELTSKIEYIIDSISSNGAIEGVLENISTTGFCMITPWPLKKWQEISIKDGPDSLSAHSATVCWIEPYRDGCYKIGLEFCRD